MTSDGIYRSPTLEFLITNACNLRCKYCFLTNGRLGYEQADIETIKDFIKQRGSQSFYVFGGEPLVNIKGICELIDYAESLDLPNKEEVLHGLRKITTNGTLIEKHLDLIRQYKLELQISLDGDEEGNSDRVTIDGQNSFNQVIRGVELCQEHKIPYTIHGVLSQRTALRYAEIVVFLFNLLRKDPQKTLDQAIDYFKGNYSMFVLEEDYTDSFINLFLTQLEKLAYWIDNASEFSEDQKKRFFTYTILRPEVYGVCGAGTGLKTINGTNTMYPCHRAVDNPHKSLGNLLDSSYQENLEYYSSLLEQKLMGFVYSPFFYLAGLISSKKSSVGWAMWCPETNSEVSNDSSYVNAKYAVLVYEINRYTNYLKEKYKII